jgi:hypothetical protein
VFTAPASPSCNSHPPHNITKAAGKQSTNQSINHIHPAQQQHAASNATSHATSLV